MSAREVRRRLSPMERWYWICDQLSPLNVVARVHVRGACPAQDLQRAGVELVREHPLLRVAVATGPDDADPRFVEAGRVDLPIRTVRAADDDAERWQREVDETELRCSVAGPGPLARIVDVVRGGAGAPERHDLILTVSHVIADGTTALTMLRRLVELAAGGGHATSRPALPPPEAMLPRWINGLPRAAHLVAWVVADNLALVLTRPRRLAPVAAVRPGGRRTRLLHRELDADQLGALVERCRREGTTVHGALAAAMATAVADQHPAARRRRVCLGSPVDFRAELSPPVAAGDAGAYVATVPSYPRIGAGGDLWTVARAVSRDLDRRRRLHHHLALVSLLPLLCPRSVARSARAVAVIERAGPGNVCLSNLGRFDFPNRSGSWRLSGAQFIAGISISGYLVAAVNTSHGALHWNFTYIEGAVPAERARQIADRAVRLLLSAVRGGRDPRAGDRRAATTAADAMEG